MENMMKMKPQKIRTVAIIWIVDGIWSILWGVGIILVALGSVIGVICLPVSIYPFMLGVVEVVYGIKLLNDPVQLNKPPTFVSMMEIGNILFGDVIGLIAGIVTLTLLKDDDVKEYFQNSGYSK